MGKTYKDKKKWEEKQTVKKNKEKRKTKEHTKPEVSKTKIRRFEWYDIDEI